MPPWHVIFDAHFHLNDHENYDDSVGVFLKRGGNSLNLVNLPDYSIPPSNYYDVLYERTIRIASHIEREYGLHVIVSLGPYPLDYFYFQKSCRDPFSSLMEGLEKAGKLVENNMAGGLGEVGRVHFESQPEINQQLDIIMKRSFEIARDLHCFVMLHTEDLTPESISIIERIATESGLLPEKVIKHHSTGGILDFSRITKSFPATRPMTNAVASSKEKGMLETDFVDDRKNPQRFLPPDSVPKRAMMIKQSFENPENILYSVFQSIPYRCFDDDFFLQ